MEEIYAILKEVRPEYDFKGSEDYVEDGFLDSFDIITIVSMLEEKYHIQIDGLDIIPDNFCTAAAIIGLLKKNGVII